MKKAITLLMALVMVLSVVALCVSAEEETYVYQPKADGNFLVGVSAHDEKNGTDYKTLCASLPNTIIEVKQWTKGTALTLSDTGKGKWIATGDSIRINAVTYTAVVKGDVDGNGTVDAADYLLVKRFYLGTYEFGGEGKADAAACRYAAGDTDGDGEIKAVEYLKIKRHVLGNYDLNKDYRVLASEIGDDESGWTSEWH